MLSARRNDGRPLVGRARAIRRLPTVRTYVRVRILCVFVAERVRVSSTYVCLYVYDVDCTYRAILF